MMINSIEELKNLLNYLREELTSDIRYSHCPACGKTIYDSYYKEWKNGHVPYYSIEGGRVRVGYRCGKSNDPIIIYDISLKEFTEEFKGEKTRYLE